MRCHRRSAEAPWIREKTRKIPVKEMRAWLSIEPAGVAGPDTGRQECLRETVDHRSRACSGCKIPLIKLFITSMIFFARKKSHEYDIVVTFFFWE